MRAEREKERGGGGEERGEEDREQGRRNRAKKGGSVNTERERERVRKGRKGQDKVCQSSRWCNTAGGLQLLLLFVVVLFCFVCLRGGGGGGGGGGGVSPFNLTSSSLTTSSNAMPNLSFVDGNCQYPIQGIHTARTFVWCGVCKLPCLHQTLTG